MIEIRLFKFSMLRVDTQLIVVLAQGSRTGSMHTVCCTIGVVYSVSYHCMAPDLLLFVAQKQG